MDTSLLRHIDCSRPVLRRYDIGMSDFVDSSAFCDGKENRALSLLLRKKRKSPTSPSTSPSSSKRSTLGPVADNTGSSSSRFDFSKSPPSYSGMAVKFVPTNTKKNNDWAYNNFNSWREARNRAFPTDQCPLDLIETPPWDCHALCYCLARFACETRNKEGKKYPATTVFSLLSALLRRMRGVDADCPNFLDAKDARFKEMHCILDAYFRELRNDGVGAEVKKSSLVTREEEDALWENGVLGVDTSECLLHAIFFTTAKISAFVEGKNTDFSRYLKLLSTLSLLCTIFTQRMGLKIGAVL